MTTLSPVALLLALDFEQNPVVSFSTYRVLLRDMKTRCNWGASTILMEEYHDTEWGVPVHDDQKWFEFLILEGFQAGLSWATILGKRENFKEAFDNFDAEEIAAYDAKKVKILLSDKGIVRNRLKIAAAIKNANLFLEIQKTYGSFDNFIWQFVNGKPIVNKRKSMGEIPVTTKESDEMSTILKAKGFTFVGSTICYALMQATGMVNDHETDCFRYKVLVKRK